MPLSMSQASTPVFVQLLTALSGILDKARAHAEARKIDPSVLLNTRLYPDMFPLARQVQIACDFAKNTVGRLSGAEIPKFEDKEATFDELKARIAKTLDYVNSIKAAQLDGTEDKTVTFPMGPQTMSIKGRPYLVNFALPNFYFHLSMAYAILRHCGVEVGKRDFVGAFQ